MISFETARRLRALRHRPRSRAEATRSPSSSDRAALPERGCVLSLTLRLKSTALEKPSQERGAVTAG